MRENEPRIKLGVCLITIGALLLVGCDEAEDLLSAVGVSSPVPPSGDLSRDASASRIGRAAGITASVPPASVSLGRNGTLSYGFGHGGLFGGMYSDLRSGDYGLRASAGIGTPSPIGMSTGYFASVRIGNHFQDAAIRGLPFRSALFR